MYQLIPEIDFVNGLRGKVTRVEEQSEKDTKRNKPLRFL